MMFSRNCQQRSERMKESERVKEWKREKTYDDVFQELSHGFSILSQNKVHRLHVLLRELRAV